MSGTVPRGFLALAILISVMLIAAGCASVPGPGSSPTPAPTKTATPPAGTPPVTASPVKTLRTLSPVQAPLTPSSSPTLSPATTLPEARYSVKTCAELGGFVVSPGERCPGTWLDGTETFSCCSAAPVADIPANLSIVVMPLDLHVNLSDDPGRIVP